MLLRLLKIDYTHLKNAKFFEDKYGLTRSTFIKIFNLYSVLSFKTIFKELHKNYEEPLGETPGMSYKAIRDIKSSGIDYKTLENDSFPQLKIENSLMVHQLFKDLKN
jgi:hypothetical protein